MRLSRRINQPEIMDTMQVSEIEMTKTLKFLRFTNYFLGGHGIILKYLSQYLKSSPKEDPITILDVGCGWADILVAITNWAEAQGYKIQMTGIELVPQIVRLAQNHVKGHGQILIQEGDIFSWPDRQGSYDYVLCSLFLHHVPEDQLTPLIKKVDRLARRGVIVSDLLRCRAGYWSVKALSHLIGSDTVRHDGPLSVLRAFTVEELEDLAASSGLAYLKARAEPYFRVSLSGKKSGKDG